MVPCFWWMELDILAGHNSIKRYQASRTIRMDSGDHDNAHRALMEGGKGGQFYPSIRWLARMARKEFSWPARNFIFNIIVLCVARKDFLRAMFVFVSRRGSGVGV